METSEEDFKLEQKANIVDALSAVSNLKASINEILEVEANENNFNINRPQLEYWITELLRLEESLRCSENETDLRSQHNDKNRLNNQDLSSCNQNTWSGIQDSEKECIEVECLMCKRKSNSLR